MRINNEAGAKEEFTLADPCPNCGALVSSFDISYGSLPDITSGYGSMSVRTTTPRVTLGPCGCTVQDVALTDWQLSRYADAVSYNKGLIRVIDLVRNGRKPIP